MRYCNLVRGQRFHSYLTQESICYGNGITIINLELSARAGEIGKDRTAADKMFQILDFHTGVELEIASGKTLLDVKLPYFLTFKYPSQSLTTLHCHRCYVFILK